MIRVCSGFSPAGFKDYGQRFLDTFDRHWPRDIDLVVYTEAPVAVPRGECRSLWDCHGVAEFIARHKDDPEKTGRKQTKLWKPRYHGKPYCYRFDAVKFCRQLFIPEHAARDIGDGDYLIWLDADVMSLKDMPPLFVETLFGKADLVFLGRSGAHSEIGFWAVRINAATRRFLWHLAETWRSGKVFELPEWHSAFVFDDCRRYCILKERNLTPEGRGHVWTQSPLNDWLDHLKGARKALGASPERKA